MKTFTLLVLIVISSLASSAKNFVFGVVRDSQPLESFNGYQAHSFSLYGGVFGCCAGPEDPNSFWYTLGRHRGGNVYGPGGTFSLATDSTMFFCPCSYTATWQDAQITSVSNPDGTFTERVFGHLIGTLCSDQGCFDNIPAVYSQESYEVTSLPATAFGFGELTATIVPPN